MPTPPDISFRRALLTEAHATALILELNQELSEIYPETGANHFRLDADEVADGRGVFLIAYVDDSPAGCGAIRRLDQVTAEVKRMYVVPACRGRGIGKQILSALEGTARELGWKRLVLETGNRQVEAVRLYESAGFVLIPPFGEYLGSPLSVCLAKELE